MRRVLLIPIALVLALPLAAEEPETATAAPAEAKSGSAAPAQVDSPMVAAAKRANRIGRKPVFVITNETLKSSGGSAHVTTTQNQPEVPVAGKPAGPDPRQQAAIAKRAAEEKVRQERLEAAKRRMEEERLRRLAAAAEAAEQGFFDETEDVDPSVAERQTQDAGTAKPPNP